MKKNFKITLWVFGVALVLVAGYSFAQMGGLLAIACVPHTHWQSTEGGKCLYVDCSRTCQVDNQYCNVNGADIERNDLSCWTDGETVGEICAPQNQWNDPSLATGDWVCSDTLIQNCASGGGASPIEYCDLLCDIDNFMQCPGGCTSDYKCSSAGASCTNPTGEDNDLNCKNNNVVVCTDGTWGIYEMCQNDVCTVTTPGDAYCKATDVECNSASECNDNNKCTDDVCTGNNVCNNPAKTCSIGVCDPSDGMCKANLCTQATLCNDNKVCTTDACTGGICTNLLNCQNGQICGVGGLCETAQSCTSTANCSVNYVCSGGQCVYNITTNCLGYQEKNIDGICVFNLMRFFSNEGLKDFWDNNTMEIIVVGAIVVVLILISLYMKGRNTGVTI
jgi:hypothetical protein